MIVMCGDFKEGISAILFQKLFSGKKLLVNDSKEETENESHLVDTVEEVSEKVKADLSGGELMTLLEEHDLDFDGMTYEEREPVFTCPLGSVLQNNMTCGEFRQNNFT